MLIAYLLVTLISAGTLLWAYRFLPGHDDPPGGGTGEGGLPVGGDSQPSSDPPSFVVNPSGTPEDESSPNVPA